MARMALRDAPGLRSNEPARGVPVPAPDEEDVPLVGNFVHLDDAFAHLDGQIVPLSDIEVARIQGIIVHAYQRKLSEELKRVKSAYTMHGVQRKRNKVQKSRRPRRQTMREAPPPAPATPATSEG
jgi:hypothetical protein